MGAYWCLVLSSFLGFSVYKHSVFFNFNVNYEFTVILPNQVFTYSHPPCITLLFNHGENSN